MIKAQRLLADGINYKRCNMVKLTLVFLSLTDTQKLLNNIFTKYSQFK